MRSLSWFFTILTIGLSFTMNVWEGTAFALTPLLATIGGCILRIAMARGHEWVGMAIGGVMIGGAWAFMDWMDLTVAVAGLKFAGEWWILPSAALGLVLDPEDIT